MHPGIPSFELEDTPSSSSRLGIPGPAFGVAGFLPSRPLPDSPTTPRRIPLGVVWAKWVYLGQLRGDGVALRSPEGKARLRRSPPDPPIPSCRVWWAGRDGPKLK